MKKYFLLFLLIYVQISYADDLILNRVQNKLLSDKQAFSQFKYLGELHCLDNKLGFSDSRLFSQEYINFFNGLFGLPRLITKEALENNFSNFENENNKIIELYENKILFCHKLYSRESSHELYNKLILNQNSYYKSTNEEYFTSADEFQQHMMDYLKFGRIDKRRYF